MQSREQGHRRKPSWVLILFVINLKTLYECIKSVFIRSLQLRSNLLILVTFHVINYVAPNGKGTTCKTQTTAPRLIGKSRMVISSSLKLPVLTASPFHQRPVPPERLFRTFCPKVGVCGTTFFHGTKRRDKGLGWGRGRQKATCDEVRVVIRQWFRTTRGVSECPTRFSEAPK